MIARCINSGICDKGLYIYKILVFTEVSYQKLLDERGDNYVFDLFMEICRERGVKFNGLRVENGYVYAILGFYFNETTHKCGKIGRSCSVNQ
ncbi:MAG: hypothetical protein AABZ57_01860 [Candidatus Margulisiibacteriota bacterium]